MSIDKLFGGFMLYANKPYWLHRKKSRESSPKARSSKRTSWRRRVFSKKNRNADIRRASTVPGEFLLLEYIRVKTAQMLGSQPIRRFTEILYACLTARLQPQSVAGEYFPTLEFLQHPLA